MLKVGHHVRCIINTLLSLFMAGGLKKKWKSGTGSYYFLIFLPENVIRNNSFVINCAVSCELVHVCSCAAVHTANPTIQFIENYHAHLDLLSLIIAVTFLLRPTCNKLQASVS